METEVTQEVGYECQPLPSVGEIVGYTCGIIACITFCIAIIMWLSWTFRD